MTFSPDWTAWIKTNTTAGVKPDVIFGILLRHGFAYESIRQEIGYTPSVPLHKLLNPHRAPHEFLPNYTSKGFQKFPVPKPLFDKTLHFYNENKAREQDEHVEGFISNESHSKPSTTIELPDALRKEIHDTLSPLVATWSGKAVDPTYVYGIRVYKDKAVLKPHRDRIETHIFGVIINVDQDVREDWPLIIEDHAYEPHQILMAPGEMIFYESARLKHGRPIPLEGNAFANVFCHFTPSDYKSPSIRYDTPKSTDED